MRNQKFKIICTLVVLILTIFMLVNFSKNISSFLKIKNQYIYNTHYLNNLSYFKERLIKSEKEIENAPKQIISNLTHINLLNYCSKFASELKINILAYNPVNKPRKNNKEFSEKSIEINIKTGYLNLIKFINKIENLNFITRVDNLEIFRVEPYSSQIKSKIIITGFFINEK